MLHKSVHFGLQPDIRIRGDGDEGPCVKCGKSAFYVLPSNLRDNYCVDHAAELQLVINRLRGNASE